MIMKILSIILIALAIITPIFLYLIILGGSKCTTKERKEDKE